MSDNGKSDESGAGGSKASFLISFVLVTLIAAAIGFGSSMFLQPAKQIDAETINVAEKKEEHSNTQFVVTDLAPMLTNIQNPEGVWVRMEVSLLSTEPVETQTVEDIGQDLLAYLRTLRLSHINGPSGYLTLREALDDRAINHGNGIVERVLIRTLLFE